MLAYVCDCNYSSLHMCCIHLISCIISYIHAGDENAEPKVVHTDEVTVKRFPKDEVGLNPSSMKANPRAPNPTPYLYLNIITHASYVILSALSP